MSRRDLNTCLRQMLSHAIEAEQLLRGKSRSDLDRERVLNLALVRLLEVVGEAAARIKPEDRETYPHIPWAEIVALRNQLIHGYDEVDLDIVWTITTRDVPKLIATLHSILGRP